jgi:S1-C subfamily serine protease
MAGADPLYLLAVLRLRQEIEFTEPALCPPEEVLPGLLVLALGSPYRSEFSLSSGTISTPDRTIYRPERFPVDGLIVTDAAVHLGNIGGPLVDLEGRLLGINSTPMAAGLSLSIQAEVVMRLVAQILAHGRATHPWLGFQGQPETVPPAMATLLQLPVQRGVAVGDVVDGGPGDRAGVQPLDLVVALDGRPVTSLGAARRVLAERRPGDTCPLTVLRGGGLQELEMPVEEMPRLTASPWGDNA